MTNRIDVLGFMATLMRAMEGTEVRFLHLSSDADSPSVICFASLADLEKVAAYFEVKIEKRPMGFRNGYYHEAVFDGFLHLDHYCTPGCDEWDEATQDALFGAEVAA